MPRSAVNMAHTRGAEQQLLCTDVLFKEGRVFKRNQDEWSIEGHWGGSKGRSAVVQSAMLLSSGEQIAFMFILNENDCFCLVSWLLMKTLIKLENYGLGCHPWAIGCLKKNYSTPAKALPHPLGKHKPGRSQHKLSYHYCQILKVNPHKHRISREVNT